MSSHINSGVITTYNGQVVFGNSSNMFSYSAHTHIMTLTTLSGKEIVRIEKDGTVKWADDVDINAAAQALSTALNISTEQKAQITQRVKQQIRDDVFNQIIDMAKVKGVLTADELTFMFESSKIIEKLQHKDY
jgi:hypothetical protein